MIQGEYTDFLGAFSETLNFSARQFKRFDGAWGLLNSETGQWSGMISNLLSDEADFISVALTQCCGRPEVIDFIWSLSVGTAGFVIKSE